MDEYNLALLIMRVSLGLTLAAHGYNKFFKGGRIAGTASWFDSIGMRPGRVHAVLAAAGEIAAGVFLAVGLLTSFAALGFVGLMTVAYWTVHRDKGFMILGEGWEYVFILGVSAVVVAMLGPLEWSIDNSLGWDDEFDGYTGLAISAGGGVVAGAALLVAFFRPLSPSAG
ncbi:MAG: DoxX family protein [Acidimicrobiales bacterium]